MRGAIQIFNHHFLKTPGKRMNKNEKRQRRISYKSKIYQIHMRIITGKFASEKALVKKYSQHLAFLKYKLKQTTNLKVSDLSQVDQDYFDSIEKISQLMWTSVAIQISLKVRMSTKVWKNSERKEYEKPKDLLVFSQHKSCPKENGPNWRWRTNLTKVSMWKVASVSLPEQLLWDQVILS